MVNPDSKGTYLSRKGEKSIQASHREVITLIRASASTQ